MTATRSGRSLLRPLHRFDALPSTPEEGARATACPACELCCLFMMMDRTGVDLIVIEDDPATQHVKLYIDLPQGMKSLGDRATGVLWRMEHKKAARTGAEKILPPVAPLARAA